MRILAAVSLLLPLIGCVPSKQPLYYFDEGQYPSAAHGMQHLAEQGDAEAQMDLGYLYEHAIGYPQDGAQAEAWYEKAAAQGLARADVCLAQMLLWSKLVPHDEPRAVELLKHADAAGDQYAAYYLGYLYRYGQGGLPKDLTQADRYTARAGTAMRDAYDSYFRVLHDLIAGNQHFPATAVAGHYGGLVKVLFSIDGPYARDAKVTQSSGHSDLDDAAIAAVYQTYYPPLPPGALPPLYYAINIDFNTP